MARVDRALSCAGTPRNTAEPQESFRRGFNLFGETRMAAERSEEWKVAAFLLLLQCLKSWVLEPSAKLGSKSQLVECIKDLKSITLLK